MPATTEARLAFLQQADTYGISTGRVEVIETHMSWVFLIGDQACKLKKSVRNDYLDFSTVAARCHFCHEELRLNQRLAPGIYRSVDVLALDSSGQLHFGTDGEPVDCVVRMRRLPVTAMLDHALLNHQATSATMQQVAARMAAFHGALSPLYPEINAWLSTLEDEINRNESSLMKHPQPMLSEDVRALCKEQRHFLRKRTAWFSKRIQAGHIIEGHGDLRCEHVFINDNVGAIDCLEFQRTLRTLDCADEIAFLALDCERLQAPQLAAELLAAYWSCTNDWPPPALVHFYQALRACIRARIAIDHLNEQTFRHSPQWSKRTQEWLVLARRHQDCIKSDMEPPV